MIVQVKLFATLRRNYPQLGIGEAMPVELPADATVGQLLQKLAIPTAQAKIVFVGNVARGEDHVLSEGDEIGIFPPVGGG